MLFVIDKQKKKFRNYEKDFDKNGLKIQNLTDVIERINENFSIEENSVCHILVQDGLY